MSDWYPGGAEWDECEPANMSEPPKDFRPEHLKRMGVTIVKGEEK